MTEREFMNSPVPGSTSRRLPPQPAIAPAGASHSLLQMQQRLGNRRVCEVMGIFRQGKATAEVDAEVEKTILSRRGGGQSLETGVRTEMESAFGAPFGGVRVHADGEADQLNRQLSARAFTVGQDIFFRQDTYRPASESGRELIAHELTHVVQQSSGLKAKLTLSQPGDRFEEEADAVARAVVRDGPQAAGAQASGLEAEDDEGKTLQAKGVAARLMRQAAGGEKEDFERERQEMAAGVQAKRDDAGPAVARRARGALSAEQVEAALAWYPRQRPDYPSAVIQEIQDEVGTRPDGILGAFTVQAIAGWQGRNKLTADGKAGSRTLVAMFGRDIRLAPPKEKGAPAEEAEETGGGVMGVIMRLLESLGFSGEQSAEVVEGKEPVSAPKPVAAGGKTAGRRYKLATAKNFDATLDGVSLKPSLVGKMKGMAEYALDNDLVTGNVVFSSGMRSPRKAHRWSTAYQIRQGNVSLKTLAALPEGKDLDGNVWYQPGWSIKKAKANASKIWDGALAAEGYPKGDERRAPNTFGGGVTSHATGGAIDATFLWNWSRGEGQKRARETKVSSLKAAIDKRWAKKPQKKAKVLAAIDRFIGRGSYSEVAYKTVEEFGLTRPVLHATGSPEDWHYEEK